MPPLSRRPLPKKRRLASRLDAKWTTTRRSALADGTAQAPTLRTRLPQDLQPCRCTRYGLSEALLPLSVRGGYRNPPAGTARPISPRLKPPPSNSSGKRSRPTSRPPPQPRQQQKSGLPCPPPGPCLSSYISTMLVASTCGKGILGTACIAPTTSCGATPQSSAFSVLVLPAATQSDV